MRGTIQIVNFYLWTRNDEVLKFFSETLFLFLGHSRSSAEVSSYSLSLARLWYVANNSSDVANLLNCYRWVYYRQSYPYPASPTYTVYLTPHFVYFDANLCTPISMLHNFSVDHFSSGEVISSVFYLAKYQNHSYCLAQQWVLASTDRRIDAVI